MPWWRRWRQRAHGKSWFSSHLSIHCWPLFYLSYERAIYLSALLTSSWFAYICICALASPAMAESLLDWWLPLLRWLAKADILRYLDGCGALGLLHAISLWARLGLTCLGEEGNGALFWILWVYATIDINVHWLTPEYIVMQPTSEESINDTNLETYLSAGLEAVFEHKTCYSIFHHNQPKGGIDTKTVTPKLWFIQ